MKVPTPLDSVTIITFLATLLGVHRVAIAEETIIGVEFDGQLRVRGRPIQGVDYVSRGTMALRDGALGDRILHGNGHTMMMNMMNMGGGNHHGGGHHGIPPPPTKGHEPTKGKGKGIPPYPHPYPPSKGESSCPRRYRSNVVSYQVAPLKERTQLTCNYANFNHQQGT